MTNVTEETIALAKQLHAIYREALGDLSGAPYEWEQLAPIVHTAWIMVAQHIEARDSTPKYIDIYARNGGIEYKKIKMLIDEPDHK